MKIRFVGFSIAGVVLVVSAGLALYAFDLPRMPNNDMAPSLRKGDLLLACRVCGPPKRGDVVVFASPDAPEELHVRRVVGLPGDELSVKGGQVLINGEPLEQEKEQVASLEHIDLDQTAPRPFKVAYETVGKHRYQIMHDAKIAPSGDRQAETLDGYFLLADRRVFARDSRDYGPIPPKDVRAIALRVITAGDKNGERQTKIP